MFPLEGEHGHVHFRIGRHHSQGLDIFCQRKHSQGPGILTRRYGTKVFADDRLDGIRIKISHRGDSQVSGMVPVMVKAGKRFIGCVLDDLGIADGHAVGITGTLIDGLVDLAVAAFPGTQSAAVFFHDHTALFVDLPVQN